MRTLNIIHLGPGRVGKTFLDQLTTNKVKIEKQYNIRLKILAVFDSKSNDITVKERITAAPLPLVFIDTTASDKTTTAIGKALRKGGFVVMSNKKPLASNQKTFDSLFRYRNKLFFETTVGAGLPIINTIRELIESGDEILEIQGCFSGTLGYIFSLLQKGRKFSQAVFEAKEKGFTEPDPRDDLSGLDLARKALILARLIDSKISLEDIKITPLFPQKLSNLSVNDFMKKITLLDKKYNKMMNRSKKNKKTLRFVAKVNKRSCSVGLTEADLESDVGQLDGPDNIAVIKTKNYSKNPLVIKGPGAGPQVTAGGIFGDLLRVIKIVSL